MHRLLSLALAIVLLSHPVTAAAHAGHAEDPKAVELKKAVAESLAWYTDVSKASGEGLTYDGDITVTPHEKHYEVKIPGVAVLFASGFTLEVGDILAHVAGGPEEWTLSAALPARMTVLDAAKTAVADISLGGQRFAAVWIPALDTLSKVDAEYRDINIRPRGEGPFTAYIGALGTTLNMVRNADGTWTGPHTLTVEGVNASVSGSSGSAVMELRKLASHGAYDRISLEGIKTARDRIRDLLAADQEDARLSEEEIKDAIASLLKETAAVPDNYSGTLEVSHFNITFPPREGEQGPPVALSLPRLTAESRMKGFRQSSGVLSAKANVSGFEVQGIPAPLDGLIPSDAGFNVRLDNIPVSDLTQVFSGIMASAVQDDPAQRQKAEQDIRAALFSLPQTLATAGTTLGVSDTYARGRDFGTRLEGKLTAHAGGGTLPATGAMTVTLEGLDELVTKYREMGETNTEATRYIQGAVPLQLMGRLEKDAGGKSRRVYAFEFKPGGGILLNGADVGALMGLIPGSAPQAPAPDAEKKP